MGVKSPDDALVWSSLVVPASSPPPPPIAGLVVFRNPSDDTCPISAIPDAEDVRGILGSDAPGPRIVGGAVLNNALNPAVHTPAKTTNPNNPITNNNATPNTFPGVSALEFSPPPVVTSYFASVTSPTPPSFVAAAFTVQVPILRREPRSPSTRQSLDLSTSPPSPSAPTAVVARRVPNTKTQKRASTPFAASPRLASPRARTAASPSPRTSSCPLPRSPASRRSACTRSSSSPRRRSFAWRRAASASRASRSADRTRRSRARPRRARARARRRTRRLAAPRARRAASPTRGD